MSIALLGLSSTAEEKLTKIALNVELKERKRFRPSKSLDEMVTLLKIAEKSQFNDILVIYYDFFNALTTKQHDFFSALQFEIPVAPKARANYRGAEVKEAEITEDRKGKKRIVYRGKEKWV